MRRTKPTYKSEEYYKKQIAKLDAAIKLDVVMTVFIAALTTIIWLV